MDPINHQNISILFSSTCHDRQRHQLPCVPPCIIQMLYYGHNDISLGDFLKRYCFRPDYRCQTCGSEMTRHQRHIIHGRAALHVSVQQLDIPIPRANDGIFTWLACKHCTLCTPYIKMADSSLLFSFAKFLELKFHCDQFTTRLHREADDTSCQHSLHSDYLHYFSFRNKIACFQPAEITILEMRIPPTVVAINTPHSEYHHDFAAEIKHIERITEGVSYRIRQRLHTYNMEPVSSQVKDHIASSKGERDAFRARIRLLKEKVVHGGFLESGGEEMSEDQQEAEFAALQDGIAEIKRALSEFVTCWNIELESLDGKIRVFHSRRDAAVVSRTSDRDSPFTPMATEIPASSRSATPHSLLPPEPEDTLLLNTPLSSPPDSSSRDEGKAPGPSLNRGTHVRT
jgi:1-phosphatidylinositol-3-phosphate 5-kinase